MHDSRLTFTQNCDSTLCVELSHHCETRNQSTYMIDSMPIPVCRHVFAKRCTKVAGVQYDGKCYAKNACSFGWKLHLVCDSSGIPICFVVRPTRLHDTTAVDDLACTLPFGTVLLGNRGYVSEPLRHHLDAHDGVTMVAIQRANMLPNTPENSDSSVCTVSAWRTTTANFRR